MTTRFKCKRIERGDDALVARTCEVRLTGPFNLVKPTDVGMYRVRLLFPKGADTSLLEEMCEEAAEQEFGANWRKKSVKMPFHRQDEKAKAGYEGYEKGAIFINTSTKFEPTMLDKDLSELDGSEVYPGMWVLVKLKAYPWRSPEQGSIGVSLGFESLQKVKDDEKFSGGESDPTEGYEVIGDDADDDDDEAPNPFA